MYVIAERTRPQTYRSSTPRTSYLHTPRAQTWHRALKKEVEKEAAAPTYTAQDLGLTPLKKRDKLAKGEKVVVCDGTSIGWEGEVMSVRFGLLPVSAMKRCLCPEGDRQRE